MELVFAFSGWHYLYSIPLSVVSLFLILVILVQRGRGGGLTGALGGMGGQSAFGTKAGDLFTKITIIVALVWILLAMLAIQRLARPGGGARPQQPTGTQLDKGSQEKAKDNLDDGATKKAGDGKSATKPGATKPEGTKPAASKADESKSTGGDKGQP